MSEIKPIAHIRTPFGGKFGIPRQSNLVEEAEGLIVFEPEYRQPEALRGLEDYSYIWLIWEFSENAGQKWSPTVRPPRLGGNTRMGVFATRSPFRPNSLGLSSVKLLGMEDTAEGKALRVSGVDLMDGTPIYDIKPYVPYVDSHPDALGGFAVDAPGEKLEVIFPGNLLEKIPETHREALRAVLARDPRPPYQNEAERVYGLSFGGKNIRFQVKDERLFVTEVEGD